MTDFHDKLIFTHQDIIALADQLLGRLLDAAPRYLILRDLVDCDPGDPVFIEAETKLYAIRRVIELAAAQHSDGTWGRVYTQNTRLKIPFPTSEHAIRRCLALGLDVCIPVLIKAGEFFADHILGKASGSYDPRAELARRRELSGIHSRRKYIINLCSPIQSYPGARACSARSSCFPTLHVRMPARGPALSGSARVAGGFL